MLVPLDGQASTLFGLFSDLNTQSFVKDWMLPIEYHLLETMEEVQDFFTEASARYEYLAVDLETTSLDVDRAQIVGMSFSFRSNHCAYVPLQHAVGMNVSYKKFMSFFESLRGKFKFIFYNAKYDTEVLWYNGINLESGVHFEDAMLCVSLQDSNNADKFLSLKIASKRYLNREMISFKDAMGGSSEGNDHVFTYVNPVIACLYAGSDALNTLEIYEKFKYVKEEQSFIYRLETNLIDTFRSLERYGVAIDVPYFQTLARRMQGEIAVEKAEILELMGKDESEVNLDSGTQLGKVLFEELNIPNPYRTATGQYKVDAATFEKLANETDNVIFKKCIYYSKLVKAYSTYILPFIADPNLEIAHIGLKQFATSTGRCSGAGGGGGNYILPVNIQSIPSLKTKEFPNAKKINNIKMTDSHFHYYQLVETREGTFCKAASCVGCKFASVCDRVEVGKKSLPITPNIRRGFIARGPDYAFFTIDYSGVELRMAGNLSHEPKWVVEFLEGEGDLHSVTASDLFGLPKDAVKKDQRALGKTVNFLSLYGGGAFALVEKVNESKKPGEERMTIEDAELKLKRFWGAIPVMVDWREGVWRQVKRDGYAATDFGRRRPFPSMQIDPNNFPSKEERKAAWREIEKAKRDAISLKVQGTSADVMKIAMHRCSKLIRERGWEGRVFILMTIHDELVFECHKDLLADAIPLLMKAMKVHRSSWPIPLETDIEFSDCPVPNWGYTTESRIAEDGNLYATSVLKDFGKSGKTFEEYREEKGIKPLVYLNRHE